MRLRKADGPSLVSRGGGFCRISLRSLRWILTGSWEPRSEGKIFEHACGYRSYRDYVRRDREEGFCVAHWILGREELWVALRLDVCADESGHRLYQPRSSRSAEIAAQFLTIPNEIGRASCR